MSRTKRIYAPGGGNSGSYERTDPDYVEKKIARLRAEYLSLSPEWRPTFLDGLSKWEKEQVLRLQR